MSDVKLGEGMHASVYKCFKIEDKEKKQPYAVKISIGDDEEKKKAFIKEFEITHKLDNKNIVKSYDMFKRDTRGEILQIMEFVEGIELFE